MDTKTDGVDRISELPPSIIHNILSFLSAKEVARASILSKSWQRLWSSFPVMDFDQFYFVGENLKRESDIAWKRRDKEFCQKLNKFMEFVDASLLRFCKSNYCMQKLRLYMGLLDVNRSSPLIEKWIRLAVSNGVKELDLDVLSGSKAKYTLPPIILSAKSVTTLRLSRCKFDELSDPISLQSLKKLTLDNICISGETIQELTIECSLLEDLFINDCWGFKYLCISKALKLKVMHICTPPAVDLEYVKIVAPSLQWFKLFTNYSITVEIDMVGCRRLKKLELFSATFTNQEFHQFISNFPLLEELSMSCCKFLKGEGITVSSTHLRILQLDGCHNLKAIDIDTPNLLSFHYSAHSIPTASINAPCPWVIWFGYDGDVNTQWYLNIKEFLGVSNQIEELTIDVDSEDADEVSFSLDEFRRSCPSLPCEVEKLCFSTYTASSTYPDLLNGLLSICFPKTFSCWSSKEDRFYEWAYDQLRNRDLSCCRSKNIKCWRHYLKDIKIASLEDKINQVTFSRDEVMDAWPNPPEGFLNFHMDWGFP